MTNYIPLRHILTLDLFNSVQAMSETNKTKKRQVPDPSLEWTHTLIRFLKEQLQEFINLHASSQSSSSMSGSKKKHFILTLNVSENFLWTEIPVNFLYFNFLFFSFS